MRNEKLLKQIALRLKQLREEKKLSQADIYLETSINIGRIESAHANISVSTLDTLCQYLGLTLEEFFRGIGE